jgi:hypothetical protein
MRTKFALCAVAVAVMAAAGCGGDDEETTTTAATTSTTTTETTGTTGATGPADATGGGASGANPDQVADEIEGCLKDGDHVVVTTPESEWEGSAWQLAVDGGQAIVYVFDDSAAAEDAEPAIRDEEYDPGSSLSREPEVIGQTIWAAVEPGSSSLAPSQADYDEVKGCVEESA